MKASILFILTVFYTTGITAEVQNKGHGSTYVGQENRTIKALSKSETEGLLKGAGMGFAKPAELNGLPGPKHVLELHDQLDLTDKQKLEIETLFTRMKMEATALGRELLEREKQLELFFQSINPTEDEMKRLVNVAAIVRGELRATHLKYHLKTSKILNKHQTKQYFTLRGYGHPQHHHNQH